MWLKKKKITPSIRDFLGSGLVFPVYARVTVCPFCNQLVDMHPIEWSPPLYKVSIRNCYWCTEPIQDPLTPGIRYVERILNSCVETWISENPQSPLEVLTNPEEWKEIT